MTKTRIYEYAKQNNIANKKVIDQLKSMNVDVSNHMSTITEETKNQLDKAFQIKAAETTNESAPKKKEAPSNNTSQAASKEKKNKKPEKNTSGKEQTTNKKKANKR